MIRFLVAAVLLFLPATVLAAPDFMEKPQPSGGPPAETVFVYVSTMGDKTSPAQAYVEPPRAAPVGGLITLWTVTVPPADKPVDGHLGWLMAERMTFDCDGRRNRWSGGIILDGQDKVLVNDPPGDWEAIEPGTVLDTALKLACGEARSTEQGITGLAAVRADAAARFTKD